MTGVVCFHPIICDRILKKPFREHFSRRLSEKKKGFLMEFVSSTLLSTISALSDGHVRYQIGPGLGKARPLDCSPQSISGLDCSGYVQYVIRRSTVHNVRIPGGSSNQEDWFRAAGYTEVPYDDHAYKTDDVVRIGFRDRSPDLIRHVWLVINGFTYESTTKRRRNGPTSFRWDVRSDQADNCFVLGNAPNLLWTELMGTVNFA